MQVFMKGRIKFLYRDRFIFYSTVLTVVFAILFPLSVVFSYSNLPPLVPIFSSMPWGMRRLYSSEITAFLPLIMILVLLVNIFISLTIYKKFTLLSRVISFNTFLFCLLATLAYLQILFLIY